MTDAGGKVTLTASYTPWGDLLSIEGEGGFTWGYFSGIMDTATGLLYLGNGQYYDPATGRFLTRNTRPDHSNPYVPWQGNPSGALITPLALLTLIYERKRKHNKWDALVILLVLGATMGMSLSACGGDGSITVTRQMDNHEVTATIMTPSASEQYGTATITVTPPSGLGQGTPTPSWTCTFTFIPTNTPTPTATTTQTYAFLFCGRGQTCGVGQSLSPYYSWAQAQGYEIQSIGGSNNSGCNSKTSCAIEAENYISQYNETAANASFIFIGHSAGADTAVLTANDELGKIKIKGIVLLDPTLSADPQYPNVNDMESIASNIASRIPLFLADTQSDGIFANIKGAMYGKQSKFEPKLADHPIYPYIGHIALANDMDVFQDVLDAMGW